LQVRDRVRLGRAGQLQRHQEIGRLAHAFGQSVLHRNDGRLARAGAQRDVVEAHRTALSMVMVPPKRTPPIHVELARRSFSNSG
jgi:hypothetical protein